MIIKVFYLCTSVVYFKQSFACERLTEALFLRMCGVITVVTPKPDVVSPAVAQVQITWICGLGSNGESVTVTAGKIDIIFQSNSLFFNINFNILLSFQSFVLLVKTATYLLKRCSSYLQTVIRYLNSEQVANHAFTEIQAFAIKRGVVFMLR